MSSSVRTRFAPSPTGFLHVGSMRTALFAWLVAQRHKGQFILRIEDTDQKRKVKGADKHIIECLEWLGINPDEGPIYQSQRVEEGIYKKWANRLIATGRAYADPYTPQEVQAFREQSKKDRKPFLYRNHRPSDPPNWDGKTPLRFKSNPKSYKTKDAVMGELTTGPEAIDDFILIKSDGFPTYNFAHIVDDIEMKITHVIRGQEFLASLPNYRNLYEALSEDTPTFVTVPHILNEQGNKKLSKRDGAKDVLEYKKQGILPAAMINFLATLGWNDGTEQEVFTVQELIDKFDLSRVQKGGARFDERRLLWLNGAHIRTKDLYELYKEVEEYWPDSAGKFPKSYKMRVLGLVKERLKYFAELSELSVFFFEDLPINTKLISTHKQLKKIEKGQLKTWLELTSEEMDKLPESQWSKENLQALLNNLLYMTKQKPVTLFSLVRIAITQSPASPGLAETLEVLGKEKSLQRIKTQLKTL